MHPDDAAGRRRRRRDLGDRERGGVRREDGVGPADPLELGEELPLRLELLDDRLDHEVAVGEVLELGRQREPADRLVARRLLQLPLLDLARQEVADPVAGLLAQLGRDLAADRVDPGLDAELRDPGAHGTEPVRLLGAEPEADPGLGKLLAAGAILAAIGAVERIDARLGRVALDEAGALADDREVDAATLDQQLEAAADHPEADAAAAIADTAVDEEGLGQVGAGDDREVRISRGRVVDRDRAAVEPAEDAAARLQAHLAAAVLDRERALTGVRRGESRDREDQREQRQAEEGLPHGSQYRRAACRAGQGHVRKV